MRLLWTHGFFAGHVSVVREPKATVGDRETFPTKREAVDAARTKAARLGCEGVVVENQRTGRMELV